MSLREWIENTFYNDAYMIPVYLAIFAVALALLGVCIYFHELGHWIWFKLVLKKNIKIRFVIDNWHSYHWEAGTDEDYKLLTPKQYGNMMICGIACGVLPIVLSAGLWAPFILMIVPYATGVWKDIKAIQKVNEELGVHLEE